jgi:hypothetical protein
VACVVKLSGGPCDSDGDCPSVQYCNTQGICLQGRRLSLDAGEACQQVLSAYAGAASVCAGVPPDLWLRSVDSSAICASIQGSVSAGRLAYDSSRLHQCMTEIADAGCNDLTSGGLSLCPVFLPTVGLGGECHSGLDCAVGFCDTRSSCPSTCTAFQGPGEACDADAGLQCSRGYLCFAGVCQMPGKPGAPCGTTLACDPNTSFCDNGYCVPRQTSGVCNPSNVPPQCAEGYNCAGPFLSYTCQPSVRQGGQCGATLQQCAPLLYCSKVTQTCTPVGTLGQPCGYLDSFGEYAGCAEGWCQLSGFTGVCAPFTAPGQPCVEPDGGAAPACGPTAHCNQTCVLNACP